MAQAWHKVIISTLCHLQIDGQTEVVKKTLGYLLRAIVGKNLRDWDSCLPIVEFAYNCSMHNSIGMTPFEAVYGYNPTIPMDMISVPAAREESLGGFDKATQIQKIQAKVYKHLSK